MTATPGNGKVTLTWRKVNDLDVKGYLVFYGTSPRNYLGTGAAQGDSPIDAGAATTIEIGGLDNGSAVLLRRGGVRRLRAAAAERSSAPR